MLGDEGETHPSSAAAPAGSGHRSTAERVSSGRFDPFARHRRTAAICVRREKAALSSGCEPHPANAPAGSNRSSHGGDEMAEAFGVAGHV